MATVYTHIRANKIKSALMVLLTIVFALGIGATFAYAADYGPVAIVLAAVIGIPSALIGYFASDKIALAINHAQPVELENNRELYNIVENIAITAGLPTPKIYIIPDASPNAFATGRHPRTASIAVTQGLLNLLNRQELEGVIAHELAHVGDYDIRYMTVVAVLVGFVVITSDFFLRFSWFDGGRRRSDEDRSGNTGTALLVVGLVLAIVAPIFAQLMRLSISRKRESLADAKGAEITRQPEHLANALIKIAKHPVPARFANSATSHLYFADISRLKGTSYIGRLLSSHPPLEERVKKLYEMAGLRFDPALLPKE
jgi:heat shock protein HtpX